MKLCKDCKYFIEYATLGNGDPGSDICSYVAIEHRRQQKARAEAVIDYVRGIPPPPEDDQPPFLTPDYRAQILRMDHDFCGRRGKWFEAKS